MTTPRPLHIGDLVRVNSVTLGDFFTGHVRAFAPGDQVMVAGTAGERCWTTSEHCTVIEKGKENGT